MYRSAVAGSYAGAPWCAYFVSWCAAEVGAPLGVSTGQGLGSVAETTDWAKSTGRFTETPQPGDLILFGTEHVGIVESVNPDGTLTTVEGNTSNSGVATAAPALAQRGHRLRPARLAAPPRPSHRRLSRPCNAGVPGT